MPVDRNLIWTGDVKRTRARAATAGHRRPLRHDAARRRADGGGRPLARGQARDRPRTRRRGRGSHRGRLPAGLGGGLARRGADRVRGAPRRGLGLLTCRAGGCRRARRARRPGLGDREPDLRRQARGPRRVARGHAGAHPAGRRGCDQGGHQRHVLRRRLLAGRSGVLRAGVRSAVEAGRSEIAVVDTLGIAAPEAAAFLVPRRSSASTTQVPVHWHGHDDFGLATAAAIAAVQAGATWVQGTVNGMGERAGNADLVEVALALEALYGIPTRLRLEHGCGSWRGLCRRARGDAARSLEAGDGREPVHARVGRGRSAVPRPAGDRAVLLRARAGRPRHRARQEERDRLDPHQGARARTRRRGGALTRACSRRSSGWAQRRAGS